MLELYRLFAAHKKKVILLLIAGIILDGVIWSNLVKGLRDEEIAVHFLDVGQGDSELVVLPGGVRVLVDGGPPNGALLKNLDAILPFQTRSLDIVALSHPQLDHFGGLFGLFERYRVGALLYASRKGSGVSAETFWEAVSRSRTQLVELREGSRVCYRTSCFSVLSPPAGETGLSENDMSLALLFKGGGATLLFAGDSGGAHEEVLGRAAGLVDVLKVSHHGSRFSSDAEFLETILPRIAVIEVGKNSYGHPSPEVLERLRNVAALIFQTDQDGIISLSIKNGAISVRRSTTKGLVRRPSNALGTP